MIAMFRRRFGRGTKAATYEAKTLGYWDASDGLVSMSQQSLPNKVDGSTVGPLVRGSVRGAEVTPEGLYLPGSAGNSATTPVGSSVVPDIDVIVHVQCPDYSNGSNQGLIADWNGDDKFFFILAGNGNVYARVKTPEGDVNVSWISGLVDGDPYWLGFSYQAGSGLTVKKAPSTLDVADAIWEYSSPAGEANSSLTWSMADLDVGTYVDDIHSPLGGTVREALVTSFDESTVYASPNFTGHALGTKSFDDVQGNTWTINSTGSDTNDPTLDLYEGRTYLRTPGTTQGAGVTVGAYPETTAWTTRVDVSLDDVLVTTTSRVLFSHDNIQFRNTPAGFQVVYLDNADNYRYTPNLSHADIGLVNDEPMQLRCDIDTASGSVTIWRRTSTDDIAEDSGWGAPIIQETGLVTHLLPRKNRLSPASHSYNMGGASLPFSGKIYRIYQYDTENALVINDVFPDRDNKEGATVWTKADGFPVTYGTDTGADLPIRYVTGSAFANDGTDDFSDTDYIPDVQLGSGAFWCAFEMMLHRVTDDYQALVSSEDFNNHGIALRIQPDNISATPKIYARVGSGNSTLGTSSLYRDIPLNEWIKVVIQVDGGAEEIHVATSVGDNDSQAMVSGTGAMTHRAIRIGQASYGSKSSSASFRSVRIGSEVLTETERLQLVSTPESPFQPLAIQSKPVISGVLKSGKTITATDGVWKSTIAPSFTYQWYREGVAIPGATAASYELDYLDNGKNVSIVVTASAGGQVRDSETSTLIETITFDEFLLHDSMEAYLASSITSSVQQSLKSENGPEVLVRGSVRGAEITTDGLYVPDAVSGNKCTSTFDLQGLSTSLFVFKVHESENPTTAGHLYHGDTTGSRFRVWISSSGSLAVTTTKTSDAGAQTLSSGAVKIAPTTKWCLAGIDWDTGDVRIAMSEDSHATLAVALSWNYDQTQTFVDLPVKPSTVTVSAIGALSNQSFNGTIVAADLTIDGTVVASPDFAAQPIGTQSFIDPQGNEWTLSSTGSDTNDPDFNEFDGENYVRFPGEQGATLIDTTAEGVVTTTHDSVETAYRLRPQDVTIALYPTGSEGTVFQALTHPSGQLRIAHLSPASGWIGLTYSPNSIPDYLSYLNSWIWVKQKLTRSSALCEYWYSVEQVADEEDVTWISLGSSTGSNPGVEWHPAHLQKMQVGSHSTAAAIAGGELDLQYVRHTWAKSGEGDIVRTWSALSPGSVVGEIDGFAIVSPTGDVPARLVDEGQIIADGVDDKLQTSYTPVVQKDSGALSFYVDMIASSNPGNDWVRLGSSEVAHNDGVYLTLTAAGLPRVVAINAGSQSYVGDSSQDYRDDVRFRVVFSIDGDNQIMTIATSRGYYGVNSINQSLNLFAHEPWRVFERANTDNNVEGTLFETRLWDVALTEAQMRQMVASPDALFDPLALTSSPVISGDLNPGDTLTTTDGVWEGTLSPTFTYQWYRNNVLISGATSNSYKTVFADNNSAISVIVKANAGGEIQAARAETSTTNLSLLQYLKHIALGRFSATESLTSTHQQSLPNLNGTDVAVRGSVRGAEIVADGMYLPGLAGNGASGPPANTIAVVDDLDISVDCRNMSATGNGVLVEGWLGWLLYLRPDGRLWFFYSRDGIEQLNVVAATPPTSGYSNLRTTRDGASGVIRFFQTVDGVETQIGTDHAGSTGALSQSSGAMAIGRFDSGGGSINGTIQRVTVSDGAGTVYLSPDFAAQPVGTQVFDDAQGNEWTVNSTGVDTNDPVFDAGAKEIVFDGVDDKLSTEIVPTNDETVDALTVLADMTLAPLVGNWTRVWSSESAVNVGCSLSVDSSGNLRAYIGGSSGHTSFPTAPWPKDGLRGKIVVSYDGDAGTVAIATSRGYYQRIFVGGAVTGVTHDPLVFGSRSFDGGASCLMTLFNARIWDEALSQDEMEALVS